MPLGKELQTHDRILVGICRDASREQEIMEITLLLEYSERGQLREWLQNNHNTAKECWVAIYKANKPALPCLPYTDIVEEALCFGWIDSTLKRLPDGRLAQRLSPRRKNSHWTNLNKQRCRELQHRGLMTKAGRAALKLSNLQPPTSNL